MIPMQVGILTAHLSTLLALLAHFTSASSLTNSWRVRLANCTISIFLHSKKKSMRAWDIMSDHCQESSYCILIITLPWQCWKSKIQALPQVIWFFPKAREFFRPISAKCVFTQPAFPWNYPIGLRYHMILFVGVAVAEPVTATARFLFPAPLNLLWQLHIFV